MKKHAQYYAEKGLAVIPLHTPEKSCCSCGRPDCTSPGKHPRITGGLNAATKDLGQIKEWWNKWPNANIGIVTGLVSGILAVDVDCGHGKVSGEDSLKAWEAFNGVLPLTWTSLTGGGGYHYIYKCKDVDIKNKAGLLPGVDIRANGGYIVAPPSLHSSGKRYEWQPFSSPEEAGLVHLPDALNKLITEDKISSDHIFELRSAIPEGARNDTLFRLACSLRAKGLSEQTILAALREENKTRCDIPLNDLEITTIANSASKYEPGSADCRKKETSYKPGDYSDAGNAEVFTTQHQEDLIYIDALGWLFWSGQKWERDNHCALRKAVGFSRHMLREAADEYRAVIHTYADCKDLEAQKEKIHNMSESAEKYLSHARSSRNEPRIRRLVELSKPMLHCKLAELDANPFALNTPAGTVDLCTGLIRDHEQKDYISKTSACAPGSNGTELWESFIKEATCGDDNLAEFLQMAAGMSAIGAVYHEGIIIAYGAGRNGKSTFFNTMAYVLGDYAGSISVKALTTERTNKGASLATLRGKRLVLTGELEEGHRISVSMLKTLASTDKLVAEEKFKQPEEFLPSHTLILYTNHLPRIASTDEGTWRRVMVVPFNAVFPIETAIQNYAEVLKEKAGGAILSWIIDGAMKFCRNNFKLTVPDTVKSMTDTYQAQEDWVKTFISECCFAGGKEGARDLYMAYRKNVESYGEYPRRENEFAKAIEAAGYKRTTTNGRRYWMGLHLNEVEPGRP